jgi:hypothetical protein
MRDWFQAGLTLLGSVGLCVCMSGCAVEHDGQLRLSEELGRARAEAAWQGARAAELELRLSRLEQRAATSAGSRSSEQRELLKRLDRVIELNESLLAERAQASLAAANTPPAAPTPNVSTAANASLTTTPSPEEQLRALVERMHGHQGRFHGALTREQNEALRLLTKPERQLDSENPWPAQFY